MSRCVLRTSIKRRRCVCVYAFIVVVSGLASCANPVPPSGGPADTTPPEISLVEPAEGATSVTATQLVIEFSEYIDQASFLRAFSLTPGFEQPFDTSWRGRTVTIRFPERLRDNTTYVGQIDNSLRDARGVSLTAPITFAFSTGPQINRGSIEGRVVAGRSGLPVPGVDVYAFANVLPDTLSALPLSPDYRTQSGSDGRFSFRYLPEGEHYYVVVLQDANANRRADPTETYAAPPLPLVQADTGRVSADDLRFVTSLRDTVPPEFVRTRLVSSRRIALRFSEPVMLVDTTSWTIRSAQSGRLHRAMPYVVDSEKTVVVLVTDSLHEGTHSILVGTIADSSGNALHGARIDAEIVAVADTVRARFLGFAADTTASGELEIDAVPTLRFSAGITADDVRSRTTVVDSSGTPLEYLLHTETNATWHVRPELSKADVFEIAVRAVGGDSVYVRRFEPLPLSETGEIGGVVQPVGEHIVVEIYTRGDASPVGRVKPDSSGRFLARRLPAGTYFLRAFGDRDRSDTWSGGALAPYLAPEPITWSADTVRVRARWETTLEDTLRLN